ncbi:MAG: hypothetical protein KME03_17355 [Aphanocapsa lilacina HA4352-LM1]|jgi:hypothetical protein|nr:hypothetical protein [Aphanocapsa lilacina HA4352-LM1]
MQKFARIQTLGLVFAAGLLMAAAAAAQQAPKPLQTYVNDLLAFIKSVQDSTYETISASYQEQMEALYGELEDLEFDDFLGELGLPDTFALGLSLNEDDNGDPFNLGPFAPRALMRNLVTRESNRALARATQTDRLSAESQTRIQKNNDQFHTKLKDSANRAVTYASTAEAAPSTQDALKQMNQQMALVNTSIVSTSLESLKLQTDFVGGLGNLQMLVSDVGEAFDEQVRERYHQRSQQALATAAAAFAAGETFAWKTSTAEAPR